MVPERMAIAETGGFIDTLEVGLIDSGNPSVEESFVIEFEKGLD